MNEQLQNLIQQFNSLLSFFQQHVHNGSDSNKIQFSNVSNKIGTVSYTLFGTQAATSGNYSVFFTAPFPIVITAISEVHATAGTDAGSVSLDIEKLTGTTAPGSGTKVTASSFNLKGTINTVVNGSITTTLSTIQLAKGDRLALLLTGTPTSVANVTVQVTYSL